MIRDGDPLRAAHAAFVVKLASVVLAGYSLLLLETGRGWGTVLLAVSAGVVVAGWHALFGDPWPGRVADAAPRRAPRATSPDDVRPVTADDLRPARTAAVARIAAAVAAFLLTGAASKAGGELQRSGLLTLTGFAAVWLLVGGGLGCYQVLRRLERRELVKVAATVAAVDWPTDGRVLLLGPSSAWTVERQRVLAGVVPGDVVVVHLDATGGDPVVVTDGSRRSVVTRGATATAAEVERWATGADR